MRFLAYDSPTRPHPHPVAGAQLRDDAPSVRVVPQLAADPPQHVPHKPGTADLLRPPDMLEQRASWPRCGGARGRQGNHQGCPYVAQSCRLQAKNHNRLRTSD